MVRPSPQQPLRRRLPGIVTACFAFLMAMQIMPAFAEPEYLLAPGDILKISVFKNPRPERRRACSESGSIAYPLIGGVPISGPHSPRGGEEDRANAPRTGALW